MRSNRSKWANGVWAVVLIGGLLFVSYGCWVTPASATQPPSAPANPTLRWDTNNPSGTRFTLVFTGAVLDKNTGLVWEQTPDTTGGQTFNGTYVWGDATFYCANKNVGGTVGWRLPSIIELKSIQDPSLPPPFVPANIFTGFLSARYWSATSASDNGSQLLSSSAWFVDFPNGSIGGGDKSAANHAWCVRGGMNADAY